MVFSWRQYGIIILLLILLAGWSYGIAWILNTDGFRLFLMFTFAGIFSYFLHYWNGAKWMKDQFQAQPIRLRVVQRLAKKAGLSRTPNVYVTKPMKGANAFTVSYSNEDAIFVTPEIKRASTSVQAPILAHEMAHIYHRDSLVLGFISAFEQVISNLSNLWTVLLVLGPIGWIILFFVWPFLILIQFWSLFSLGIYQPLAARLMREREFQADVQAAKWTSPEYLIRALNKLEQYNRRWLTGILTNDRNGTASTHPPLEDRIQNLRDVE